MVKSSTYSDDRAPGGKTETISLTARRNKVVLSTLPCGTPSIWGKKDDVAEAILTWKVRWERKDFMKTPMFPRMPREDNCWRIWYRHVVSYAFSR